MSEVVVGWHVGPHTGVEDAVKWRDEFAVLSELGATVVMTNEGVDVQSDGTFAVAQQITSLEDGFMGSTIEDVTLDSLRDMTGRLPAGHGIPVLNDQRVLDVARNKEVFYQKFADVTTPTFVIEDSLDLVDALASLPADAQVVLKPAFGNEGKGIFMGEKASAEVHYNQNQATIFLAQHRLNLRSRIPHLKGRSAVDIERLQSDRPKEIRLFANNELFVPVVRVAKEHEDKLGHDDYVFIDPDSLDDAVVDLGSMAMQRLAALTDVDEIHAAVDIYFDPTDTSMPYKLQEINVKQPAYPGRFENKSVAAEVRRNVATQLVRMAGAKTTETARIPS